jgi:hypothetical protein
MQADTSGSAGLAPRLRPAHLYSTRRNAHVKRGLREGGRSLDHRAVESERAAVARTNDSSSLELSFVKGTAPVRASVEDRVYPVARLDDCDQSSIDRRMVKAALFEVILVDNGRQVFGQRLERSLVDANSLSEGQMPSQPRRCGGDRRCHRGETHAETAPATLARKPRQGIDLRRSASYEGGSAVAADFVAHRTHQRPPHCPTATRSHDDETESTHLRTLENFLGRVPHNHLRLR